MEMGREAMNTVKSMDTSKNDKEGSVALQISILKNGRRYKDWIRSMVKAKRSDPSIQKDSLLSQIEVNVAGPKDYGGNETVDTNSSPPDTNSSPSDTSSSPSRSTPEGLEFRLRRVRYAGHAKRKDIPDLAAPTKKRKNDILESQSTVDESKLQGKNLQCFGEECKSTTTDFVEYWVPVKLSEIQTEQYCSSLFSKSPVLCSNSYTVRMLHEILVSTKKCCDHPYLVDRSLHISLTEGVPQSEQFEAEIKLSSKLLLLHKALLEINKRGLRVLVLYQSLGASEQVNTGDILDDILHEIGRDSFVRIDTHISRSRRREVLDSFNVKKDGKFVKFVCLMETRSCVPSIKLNSIDTVIVFNSDWDPLNDMKALQKINLDSQFKRVKVFRLYSVFTIEEKILILTKQGRTPESNIRNIKGSTCQELLAWGAYFLFQKLDDIQNSSIVSHGNCFVEEVFHELSMLLPNNDKSIVHTKDSLILEVQQTEGVYPSNISLVGEGEYPLMDSFSVIEEMLTKEPPHAFWINILEGRNPKWKYLNSQSPRTRKSAQGLDDLLEAGIGASKKCRTEAESTDCETPPITRRTRNRRQSRDEERKLTGESPLQTTQRALEDKRAPETCEITQLQSACRALEMELEILQTQKAEMSKQHEDMKQQTKMAREKEIEEIHKKYEVMLQNADKAFREEEKVLETRRTKVLVNKELSESFMQCHFKSATLSQVVTKFAVEQTYKLISERPRSITVTRDKQAAEDLPTSSLPATPSSVIQESTSLSVASPNLHVSVSLQEGCLRAPAPHLRQVGDSSPSTVLPLPQMPSEPPTMIFSPVTLQQVTSSSSLLALLPP